MNIEISQERFEELLQQELRKEIQKRINFDPDKNGNYCIVNDKLSPTKIKQVIEDVIRDSQAADNIALAISEYLISDRFKQVIGEAIVDQLTYNN